MPNQSKPPLRIAIAGIGTVGGGVLKALHARGGELAERAERNLDIVAVSARDKRKPRAADISGFSWIADPVDPLPHRSTDRPVRSRALSCRWDRALQAVTVIGPGSESPS